MFGLINKKEVLAIIDEDLGLYRAMYNQAIVDQENLTENREKLSESTYTRYFNMYDKQANEYIMRAKVLTKVREKIVNL